MRPAKFTKQEKADFAREVAWIDNKGLRQVAQMCRATRANGGNAYLIPERIIAELRRRVDKKGDKHEVA